MYTILVNDDNTFTTSVKERIMKRSKLVDKLHFLCNPTYNDFDMSEFTVTMEYISPISKEYRSEVLVLSEELYKDKLEYVLPLDTNLTKEDGDIEVLLTFTKVDIDEEGNSYQYVRKTSPPAVITIYPITIWSDIIPDESLNALDQRLLKVDAQIKALDEAGDTYATTKADNIVLDEETHELYLTAEGEQIGNRIHMEDLGDVIVQANSEGLVTMMI